MSAAETNDEPRTVIFLPEPTVRPEVLERSRRAADILRPYMGKYIAQRGEEVLVAADSPHEVVVWLREHGEKGAIFRVPLDPVAETQT